MLPVQSAAASQKEDIYLGKLVLERTVVGAVAVVCISAAMGEQVAPATEPREAVPSPQLRKGLLGVEVVLSHQSAVLTHTN